MTKQEHSLTVNLKFREIKKWNENHPVESNHLRTRKTCFSSHCKIIGKASGKAPIKLGFNWLKEYKGKGFEATDALGNNYQLGSAQFTKVDDLKLMDDYQLFLKINQEMVAAVSIVDETKIGAKSVLKYFNQKNKETVLLSGDRKTKCDALSEELNIQTVYANQLPEDKADKIKTYGQKHTITMIE